ncbi:hypothetical protein GPECTOR_38g316 [Gonium pectorale]|uniref:Uncharacterized protein n=1 Tax=Gonium pectorale TaxID=33097 RepID=A0A150GB76_GONPE|nr:hypothetical protein GPECTOR_38g316 [Gonium pectorale]|eukprot:KXZ47079.1 hypothetical protein GPECTOR_38g316 [Gonium pectorale]
MVLRVTEPRRPEQGQGRPGLDLEQLLGSQMQHFCPVALRSQVYMAVQPPAAKAAEALERGGACSSGESGGSCAGPVCCVGDDGQAGSDDGEGAGSRSSQESPGLDPQSGVLLAPALEGASGSKARMSEALPYLRAYDTLGLLDVHGSGLNLILPSVSASGEHQLLRRGERAEQGALLASALPADLTTERYVTGAGLLRAGVALTGTVCLVHVVCMHQVFPWYVKPWVHSLQLMYDGQAVPLLPHLEACHVQPAVARSSPGVLDICLRAPPEVAELQLRLDFSKAFLTAFEYPPDAHRGFDVPAARVSYVDPLQSQAASWRMEQPAGEAADGDGEVITSPLLAALRSGPFRQVGGAAPLPIWA